MNLLFDIMIIVGVAICFLGVAFLSWIAGEFVFDIFYKPPD